MPPYLSVCRYLMGPVRWLTCTDQHSLCIAFACVLAAGQACRDGFRAGVAAERAERADHGRRHDRWLVVPPPVAGKAPRNLRRDGRSNLDGACSLHKYFQSSVSCPSDLTSTSYRCRDGSETSKQSPYTTMRERYPESGSPRALGSEGDQTGPGRAAIDEPRGDTKRGNRSGGVIARWLGSIAWLSVDSTSPY